LATGCAAVARALGAAGVVAGVVGAATLVPLGSVARVAAVPGVVELLEDVPWPTAYAWPDATLSSCLSQSSSRRRKERAEAKVCGGDLDMTMGLRWR